MKREKKKKGIIILCIVIVILLIGYGTYKWFLLSRYHVHTDENIKEIKSGFKITDTITVNPTLVEDSLTFGNVKIRNDFKEFERIDTKENGTITYVLKSTPEEEGKGFTYSLNRDRVFQLQHGDKNELVQEETFEQLNAKKILEQNHIENDIDLVKYLAKRDIKTPNLFTSIRGIKENYFFNYVMLVEFPKMNSITLIDGQYEGYILNSKDLKEINILKDDQKYSFLLIGKSFDDEYVKSFLNNLIIE